MSEGELTTQGPSDYRELMAAALAKGPDGVAALERLVALQERYEERQAARAFHDALRAFQADCPEVKKTKTAKIATKSGASWGYTYAPLEEITRTIKPHLERHGLSFSWDSSVSAEGLLCICTVRHIDGHSITATFTCPVEMSGQRSVAQNHAATLTYARRQSLVQALGLTSADDDGDGGGPAAETVTDEQARELEALIADTGADRAKFLKWGGVSKVADLPAEMRDEALRMLRAKAGRG